MTAMLSPMAPRRSIANSGIETGTSNSMRHGVPDVVQNCTAPGEQEMKVENQTVKFRIVRNVLYKKPSHSPADSQLPRSSHGIAVLSVPQRLKRASSGMLRILPAVQNGWWWHVVAFTSDGAPCYQQLLLLLLLSLLLRLLKPFMFVSRTCPSRHTSGSLILVATAKIGLRGPDGDVRQPRRSRWKAMPPTRCRRTVGLLENKKDAGKEGRSPFVDAEPVRVRSTIHHPASRPSNPNIH
ncbi:hypothetical protein V8C44DRAFT_315094 [Trichoderma aethiopicum]